MFTCIKCCVLTTLRIHDLFLESNDRGPFLFEESGILGLGIGDKAFLPGFTEKGVVGFMEVVGLEVVEDGFVELVLLPLGEDAGAVQRRHRNCWADYAGSN